jgi:hypothetical protein
MKIYNPFSLIKQLKSEIKDLKFENKMLKLKVLSKEMDYKMQKSKNDSLEKELKALKVYNNKLIGEKLQLNERLNYCLRKNYFVNSTHK